MPPQHRHHPSLSNLHTPHPSLTHYLFHSLLSIPFLTANTTIIFLPNPLASHILLLRPLVKGLSFSERVKIRQAWKLEVALTCQGIWSIYLRLGNNECLKTQGDRGTMREKGKISTIETDSGRNMWIQRKGKGWGGGGVNRAKYGKRNEER